MELGPVAGFGSRCRVDLKPTMLESLEIRRLGALGTRRELWQDSVLTFWAHV